MSVFPTIANQYSSSIQPHWSHLEKGEGERRKWKKMVYVVAFYIY